MPFQNDGFGVQDPSGGGAGGVSQTYVDNADATLQSQIDALLADLAGYVPLGTAIPNVADPGAGIKSVHTEGATANLGFNVVTGGAFKLNIQGTNNFLFSSFGLSFPAVQTDDVTLYQIFRRTNSLCIGVPTTKSLDFEVNGVKALGVNAQIGGTGHFVRLASAGGNLTSGVLANTDFGGTPDGSKFLRDDMTWAAATATDATKLPLAGGTMSGGIVLHTSGNKLTNTSFTTNTIVGTDNAYSGIGGGGAESVNRGGFGYFYGNEYGFSLDGYIQLIAGNVSGSQVQFKQGSNITGQFGVNGLTFPSANTFSSSVYGICRDGTTISLGVPTGGSYYLYVNGASALQVTASALTLPAATQVNHGAWNILTCASLGNGTRNIHSNSDAEDFYINVPTNGLIKGTINGASYFQVSPTGWQLGVGGNGVLESGGSTYLDSANAVYIRGSSGTVTSAIFNASGEPWKIGQGVGTQCLWAYSDGSIYYDVASTKTHVIRVNSVDIITVNGNGMVERKSYYHNFSTKTTAYTTTAVDSLIIGNHATVAFTITLHAATGSGQRLIIKNIGAAVVTVDGNASETIDGVTTQALNQWSSITILDRAAGEWVII